MSGLRGDLPSLRFVLGTVTESFGKPAGGCVKPSLSDATYFTCLHNPAASAEPPPQPGPREVLPQCTDLSLLPKADLLGQDCPRHCPCHCTADTRASRARDKAGVAWLGPSKPSQPRGTSAAQLSTGKGARAGEGQLRRPRRALAPWEVARNQPGNQLPLPGNSPVPSAQRELASSMPRGVADLVPCGSRHSPPLSPGGCDTEAAALPARPGHTSQ